MTAMQFSEVIKIKDGLVEDLPLHVDRMVQTTRAILNRTVSFNLENLCIPDMYKIGIVKCRVVYGFEIQFVTFELYQIRKIKSVRMVIDNDIDYCYKYADRGSLQKLFDRKGDTDDVLIIKNGSVTDLSYANVVFQDDAGKLFTPATPLLNGIKRQKMLTQYRISECIIRPDDIVRYKGFYVINTMIDLEDNVFIDRSQIV